METNENLQQEIIINSIEPIGLVSTNREFFNQITKPLYQAKTVQEMKTGATRIGEQLNRLNIFKSIEIEFDTAENVSDNAVNVIYKLTESSNLYAGTGFRVGSSQGDVVYFINFDWEFML